MEFYVSNLKSSISSILEQMNINEIYHIDDCYISEEIDKNIVLAQYNNIDSEFIKNLFEENNKDFVEDEEIDKETLRETWESLTPSTLKDLKAQIDESFKWDNVATKVIDELLGDSIKKLTPKQWEENKNTILEKLKTTKILFLFDNDWGIAKNSAGISEIKKVLEINDIPEGSIFCALYTHTVNPGDEYLNRKTFSEIHDIDINKFLVISKKHEHESFVSLLRTTALIPTLHSFKDTLIDRMQSISEEIKDYFTTKIDILDLEYILLDVSENEGDFETETLYRLHKNIHYQKFKNQISVDETINQTIKKMRKIKNISKKIKLLKPKNTFNIMHNEFYHLKINKINCPIKSGDIFEFNDKQFILLAQPCDLMIRKDGKRSYPKYKHFVNLLEISCFREENKSSGLKLLKYYKNDDKFYYINYTKALKVELDILDLCVYNEEGEVKIDLNQQEKDHRLESNILRYKKIHTKFMELFALVEGIHKIDTLNEISIKSLEKKILVSDYSDLLFNLEIDFGEKIINFGFKRVARLNKDLSQDALLNFMNFNSRLAHDVDLGYKEN